jgi:hypothetical protein
MGPIYEDVLANMYFHNLNMVLNSFHKIHYMIKIPHTNLPTNLEHIYLV